MEIQPKTPSNKGPAEMFTGEVWFDVIAKGEEPSQLRVNMVSSHLPQTAQPVEV